MSDTTYRILMNGVTGRMGYRQHLLRSILAIRDDGGVPLPRRHAPAGRAGAARPQPEKLARIADQHGIADWYDRPRRRPRRGRRRRSTSTRRSPASARRRSSRRPPPASTSTPRSRSPSRSTRARSSSTPPRGTASSTASSTTSSTCPGLMKLKRLIDSGFFGRILSVRGEFGYWVFEGDCLPAQRPSWNYRAEDGGGMVLDMFCHWNYVLENLFGGVEAVTAKAVTHIPERWDEKGERYDATADDAAYAIFELAGGVIAQVNSSLGGAGGAQGARGVPGRRHPRLGRRRPLRLPHPARAVARPSRCGTPTCPPTEDFRGQWQRGARQPGVRQRLPRPVGAVPARRRTPAGRTPTTSRPACAACGSSTPALQSSRRGRGGVRMRCERTQPVAGTHPLRVRPSRSRRRRAARWRAVDTPSSRAEWRRTAPRRLRSAAGSRFAAAHVVGRPARRERPRCARRRRLGRRRWRSAGTCSLRLRRRRGDGHRAAQHGPGLAGRPGAGPPQRRAGPRRTAPGSRPAPAPTTRADLTTLDDVPRRLHRAGRVRRGHRRAGDPDGVAPARRRGRAPPTTTCRVYDATCSARCASRSSCTGWARRSTRSCAATGAPPTSTPRPRRSSSSSARTPTRSTGSRSRCSRPSTRSGCAPRCPTGVRLYTGDDFNYPELIRGDGTHHSDALLGAFAAIAPGRVGRAGGARRGRPRDVRRGDGADAAARRATSSRRRPTTTRPASRSCPGSAATSRASPWSAACSRRAASCTSVGCSRWRTTPGCCPTRSSPPTGSACGSRARGSSR